MDFGVDVNVVAKAVLVEEEEEEPEVATTAGNQSKPWSTYNYSFL